MSLEEWRHAISTPPAYRFGNSTFRFQTKFVLAILILTVVGVLYVALPYRQNRPISNDIEEDTSEVLGGKKAAIQWSLDKSRVNGGSKGGVRDYNDLYPLSKPVSTEKGLRYRIGIISDLDVDSKSSGGKWISYLRRGDLFLHFDADNPKQSKVAIEWESREPRVVRSGLSLDDRGMELSELIFFNGKLYTCDDRTGVIYQLMEDDAGDVQPVPWVILADGNGTLPKGFKCEWALVKDEYLYVGGLGKEWTTPAGELVNFNPQFVKKISTTGEVTHLDWRRNYQKMSSEMGVHFPGYVIHESGGWSRNLKKWMFLPRRSSKEQYNEKTDEKKGTNVMLVVNEDFTKVDVRTVGEIAPTHGFSSFKWIPGTKDQLVVALKSEEIEGKTATYVMAFDMQGNVILPETKVGDHKYEGIEFL